MGEEPNQNDMRLTNMIRIRRLVLALAVLGSVVAMAALPVMACSIAPPVFMDVVEAALLGEPPPDRVWNEEREPPRLSGLIEYEVVYRWDRTSDFEAMSVHVPVRSWGIIDSGNLATSYRGGQARPARDEFGCGISRAGNLGSNRYQAFFGDDGRHPIEPPMTSEIEALLIEQFGEPVQYEIPEFDERHPGYERFGVLSTRSGRLWLGVGVLLVMPLGLFGAWLWKTRRVA